MCLIYYNQTYFFLTCISYSKSFVQTYVPRAIRDKDDAIISLTPPVNENEGMLISGTGAGP